MPRVFISYRRGDSASATGRLFDHLSEQFGKECVFRDVDDIPPGADFAKVIDGRIGDSDALVAVIGKGWLKARDADGRRRLDDPNDYVRAEIRAALEQHKLVIPVLVDGAPVPRKTSLPAEIAALAGRNAVEISETRFGYDVGRLVEAIRNAGDVPGGDAPTSRSWARRLWRHIADRERQRTLSFVGTGVAAMAVGGWALYAHFFSVPPLPPVGQTVVIVVSPSQYAADLRTREQQLVSQLAQSGNTDKELNARLRRELQQVQLMLQDPQSSLKARQATLVRTGEAIEDLQGAVASQQREVALRSLARNDTAAAEAVLAEAAASGHAHAAQSSFQLGELAFGDVDYAKAYSNYSKAARLQPLNPVYLNMAGRLAHELGLDAEAQDYLERALEIRKASLGPGDPDLAESFNNLALVYKTKGFYPRAEQLYLEALRIREDSPQRDEPATARILNNLALLYKSAGRPADAERLYAKALELVERSPGRETADMATALNNLAGLYSSERRYADAQPLYERALAIRRKVLSADHPDIAGSLNNLAGLFDAQGRHDAAEPLYRQALEIQTKSLPPNHPALATTLNNLGELYRKQRLYSKAEAMYRKALDIQRLALGADQPEAWVATNNLGLLYLDQGQLAKAEPLLHAALDGLEAKLPPDHPTLAAVMTNYANCLDRLGRADEARHWRSRADEIRRQRGDGGAK